MKDVILSTDKEVALAKECCNIINKDPKLKKFFAGISFDILKEYGVEVVKACEKHDIDAGKEVIQKAIEGFKALTMLMYVEITIKKEVK